MNLGFKVNCSARTAASAEYGKNKEQVIIMLVRLISALRVATILQFKARPNRVIHTTKPTGRNAIK